MLFSTGGEPARSLCFEFERKTGIIKIYALNRIMKHQAGIEAPFTASMADAVCLYKMTTNDFTCKIRAK